MCYIDRSWEDFYNRRELEEKRWSECISKINNSLSKKEQQNIINICIDLEKGFGEEDEFIKEFFSDIVNFEKQNSQVEYSTGSTKCTCNCVKPIKVIFNKPATIVWFNDGDKVVSKWDGEGEYNKMTGFLTCYYKKFGGESILDLWEKFEESDKIILD